MFIELFITNYDFFTKLYAISNMNDSLSTQTVVKWTTLCIRYWKKVEKVEK